MSDAHPPMEVTGAAQKQAWAERVLPPVEEVRPGLWSIPTVIPKNPLRYVISYAMEHAGGLALVDTGWPSDASWDDLSAGLATIGSSPADIKAVLITHAHGDHYGLVQRIRQQADCWVGLHPADNPHQEGRSLTAESYLRLEREWFRRRGGNLDDLVVIVASEEEYRELLLEPDREVNDGERPLGPNSDLVAVWTPGHTPGHTCFYDERRRLMLTGDHVLPRITPNISTGPYAPDEGLTDYLASLIKLVEFDVDEVLPAHEYRFRPLAGRVHALRAHHKDRLAEVLRVVDQYPGCTTAAIAEQLHWSRPWAQMLGPQRRFAFGEAHAHALHLERYGFVRNCSADVDIWRLVSTTAPDYSGPETDPAR